MSLFLVRGACFHSQVFYAFCLFRVLAEEDGRSKLWRSRGLSSWTISSNPGICNHVTQKKTGFRYRQRKCSSLLKEHNFGLHTSLCLDISSQRLKIFVSLSCFAKKPCMDLAPLWNVCYTMQFPHVTPASEFDLGFRNYNYECFACWHFLKLDGHTQQEIKFKVRGWCQKLVFPYTAVKTSNCV